MKVLKSPECLGHFTVLIKQTFLRCFMPASGAEDRACSPSQASNLPAATSTGISPLQAGGSSTLTARRASQSCSSSKVPAPISSLTRGPASPASSKQSLGIEERRLF